MKRVLRTLGVAAALCGWLGTSQASAALIHFDVDNHPRNDPSGTHGYASFIPNPGFPGYQSFRFATIGDMFVDTLTGNATIAGDMIHNLSGQSWRLSATFTGIRSMGTFNGSNTVPYDAMFTDLLNAGSDGGAIIWGTTPPNGTTTQLTLTLATDLASPAYTGPRSFIGKGMGDMPFILSWRDQQNGFSELFFDPVSFPGAQWDILGASGWYSPTNQVGAHGGDLHISLRNPTIVPPVIPEPMSAALFGMGTLLMGWSNSRRRRTGLVKLR